MSASKAPTKTPDGPGRMTYMMQQLRGSVLCPVCLLIPSSRPIFSCPNGHSVCSKCKRNECPTCRAAMGSMRNRVAEMVINVIDHECSHDGCAEQIPLSQLHQHEEDCPFKPILCPSASCNKYVIMKRFVSHLKRKHLLSKGFGELANSLEYPERIQRGLEWTQFLKRLSVLCLSVCKFSLFLYYKVL